VIYGASPQDVFLLNFWILIKLLEITTYYLFNKYPYFELMIHKNDAVIYHLLVQPDYFDLLNL